jgi:ATP-dependent helicase HrpA
MKRVCQYFELITMTGGAVGLSSSGRIVRPMRALTPSACGTGRARLAAAVLDEYSAAQRKLKDSRPPREVAEDITGQLRRLVPKRFVLDTPYAQLQHLPRYLRAIVLRLDKHRGDSARDAARLAELRPLEQRWLRRVAERRGAGDARLDEYRWLLEELRVGLFAQELRTPQPVSVKRLNKAWEQMG